MTTRLAILKLFYGELPEVMMREQIDLQGEQFATSYISKSQEIKDGK
jgi:hypothetical protein